MSTAKRAFLLILGVFVAVAGDSLAQTRPGQVFRGLISTGIWVELAHDGFDRYELAILDGLPGQAPETRFITLTPDRSGVGCVLRGTNGAASISACPDGSSFGADVSIGQAEGRATLQTVGWNGSFAWGRAAQGVSQARASCLMTSLSGAPGLSTTNLGPAVAAVAADARGLATPQDDLASVLTRLRADRLRAYSVIALSPSEAAEAQRLEDAVAGRPVLGRVVPLAQATREQSDFNTRIANSPPRERAREELRQVDRALSEIYDTTTAATQRALLTRLENDRLPAALRALETTLTSGQPGAINDLIAWDGAVGELDACVNAVAGVDAGARAAVSQTLARRADELAEAMRLSVTAAGSASAGREALQRWENNATVMAALRQAGRSDIFVALRGQVTQIAQAEERARLDGERRAAQQAAADRIAPTASGGRFQSERLSRSVVMLFNYEGSSTGSGFIVAPEIVVTNMHVVTPEGELYAVNDGSNLQARVRAQVIYRSDVHDIAILRVPGLTGQIVELAGPEPSRGADVWASGFPGLADRARQMDQNSQRIASMTRGIVSRVYDGHTSFSQGRGSPSRLVQHDANVFHGNSGGPLFDVCNRVIGVNTQIRNEDGLTVFYAVSATVLPYLLRQAGVTPRVSQSRC